jgi:MFS family permease
LRDPGLSILHSTLAFWLMTDLDPDPFIVSMVEVATTLPLFLFALPAGALADIVDRRIFLIVAVFAAIVWSGLRHPAISCCSRSP